MLHFSILGIRVTVHPWFWLTLAFIGGALEANSFDAILKLALFILAGFISVLVHELGHALTTRAFGGPTSITLHAFGGYATFPITFTRLQDFLVTAAGPGIQLLLAAVVFAGYKFIPIPNESLQFFVYILIVISIVWAVLNLIPVLPLDGGRLMQALMGPRHASITLGISIITALILGVVSWRLSSSFLLPIFMGFLAYQNWRQLQSLPR